MDSNTPEVICLAERVGPTWRGIVVDQRTHEVLLRTATYISAETAKSAASSAWRVKLAQLEQAVA